MGEWGEEEGVDRGRPCGEGRCGGWRGRGDGGRPTRGDETCQVKQEALVLAREGDVGSGRADGASYVERAYGWRKAEERGEPRQGEQEQRDASGSRARRARGHTGRKPLGGENKAARRVAAGVGWRRIRALGKCHQKSRAS